MVQGTSKEAYMDIVKRGILSQNQKRVYQILFHHGH